MKKITFEENDQRKSIEIMTVTGPILSSRLGITLMHEHLFVDARSAVAENENPEIKSLKNQQITLDNLAILREHPYANLENCVSDSIEEAVSELGYFQDFGGNSIVEVTSWNGGRNPGKLFETAMKTGLNIIMGTGLYLERIHPNWVKHSDVNEIADQMEKEINFGVNADEEKNIKPGIIGEIGISPEFTSEEEKSLRSACIVQTRTGLPLMIHLPAWERYGHNVVDICEQQGVNPKAIILAHMDPSIYDWKYQKSLLNRGINIEFDGIGMGLYYEGEGQCPSDDEISKAVVRVISSGYGDSLLLSQDVFLKIQRRKYGGNGYAHLLRSFIPRLQRMGLSRENALDLLISNPKRVFEEAAQNI